MRSKNEILRLLYRPSKNLIHADKQDKKKWANNRDQMRRRKQARQRQNQKPEQEQRQESIGALAGNGSPDSSRCFRAANEMKSRTMIGTGRRSRQQAAGNVQGLDSGPSPDSRLSRRQYQVQVQAQIQVQLGSGSGLKEDRTGRIYDL